MTGNTYEQSTGIKQSVANAGKTGQARTSWLGEESFCNHVSTGI